MDYIEDNNKRNKAKKSLLQYIADIFGGDITRTKFVGPQNQVWNTMYSANGFGICYQCQIIISQTLALIHK